MEETYYKTWDNISRRYLIKKNPHDEWQLSPTPSICCTKGRTLDPKTGTYTPPPGSSMKKSSLPVFWDPEEGRWIFKVTTCTLKKQRGQDNEEIEREKENFDICSGIDVIALREKYF